MKKTFKIQLIILIRLLIISASVFVVTMTINPPGGEGPVKAGHGCVRWVDGWLECLRSFKGCRATRLQ